MIPNIQKNVLSILFWLRKSKVSKKTGLPYLYCRITLNGERATPHGFSTGIGVKPENWHSALQMIATGEEQADIYNAQLQRIKMDLQKIHAHYELAGNSFTALEVQNFYCQKSTPKPKYTLAKVVELWEDRFKQYIELGEKAPHTQEAYHVHHTRAIAFFGKDKLLTTFKASDWEGYRLHLRQSTIARGANIGKPTHPNTIAKYLTSFRALFELALENEWIAKNPFHHKKTEKQRAEKVFLPHQKVLELESLPAVLPACIMDIYKLRKTPINFSRA